MQIQRHCHKNADCSQFTQVINYRHSTPMVHSITEGCLEGRTFTQRSTCDTTVYILKVTDRMSLTSVSIHEKCRHTWIQDSRKRLRIAVPPLLGIFPQDLGILRFNFGFGDFSGKSWDFYSLWETYILRDVLKTTFVSLQWLSPICNPFLPLEWLDMSPLP